MIKDSLPKNLSLADELAEVLDVSKDSAYRRLRGETTLSLSEIQKLCNHFEVSLDTLLSASNDSVTFQYRSIDGIEFTFEDWLHSILANLQMINQFEVKELIYLAKDIPPFHHYQFPKLAEFKNFFWLKTVLNDPDFKNKSFEFGELSGKYQKIGKEIWDEYVVTPSLEVWSFETINITLRQIEFYRDCGLFNNKEDPLLLIDDVQRLVNHVREQAEQGRKFKIDSDLKGAEGNFQLFSNEVNIADTTIFFKMGETKITFITHNNLNILATSNVTFCENTEKYIRNLLRKSSIISSSSEKERTRFFNRLNKKIQKVKEVLS